MDWIGLDWIGWIGLLRLDCGMRNWDRLTECINDTCGPNTTTGQCFVCSSPPPPPQPSFPIFTTISVSIIVIAVIGAIVLVGIVFIRRRWQQDRESHEGFELLIDDGSSVGLQ